MNDGFVATRRFGLKLHQGIWERLLRRFGPSVILQFASIYEKVVKVQTDVAAFLNSFPPTPISSERGLTPGGTRLRSIGRIAQGGASERFDPPLRGGRCINAGCQLFWLARSMRGLGGPSPPRRSPGGKRERRIRALRLSHPAVCFTLG